MTSLKKQTTLSNNPSLNHGICSVNLIMIEKEIIETEERLLALFEKREQLREEAKRQTSPGYVCPYLC